MSNPRYLVQRTRVVAKSHVERYLRREVWPFVIIEEKGAKRKVIMAVASDGMPPTHAKSAALAERVVQWLNGKEGG